jgi:hypothetical protein
VHDLQCRAQPLVGEHPQPARRQIGGLGDVGAQHLEQQQLAQLSEGECPTDPFSRHLIDQLVEDLAQA